MEDVAGAARAGAAVDRRSLIKRAAVVGGLAWTAPVVLGSLAAPAGAVTVSCTCTNGKTLKRTWAEILTDSNKYDDFNNKCAQLGGGNIPTPTSGCVPDCWTSVSSCTDPLGGSHAFNKPVPSGGTVSITLASSATGCRIISGKLACTTGVPSSVSSCSVGVLSNSDRTITFNKCASGNKAFVYMTWCC